MFHKIINTPWPLKRWLRLIIGLLAVINIFFTGAQWYNNKMNIVILLGGLYFLYKALFSTACYTPAGNVPPSVDELDREKEPAE